MGTGVIFETLDRLSDGGARVGLCRTSHGTRAVKMGLGVKADTQHIPQPQHQADGRLGGVAGGGRDGDRDRSRGRSLRVKGQTCEHSSSAGYKSIRAYLKVVNI